MWNVGAQTSSHTGEEKDSAQASDLSNANGHGATGRSTDSATPSHSRIDSLPKSAVKFERVCCARV